jgi:hypothetical protein
MSKNDEIIEQRISGRSARAIAKTLCVEPADITRALDEFADATIDEKVRKHTLALELARMDRLQSVFYARALEGDVNCGALVAKLISVRCSMLGLHTPQTAVLKIVEDAAPKETSTDRIERVLAELREQDRKNGSDDPDGSAH